jgi:hypothetical protein
MADKTYDRTHDPRTDAPGPHSPKTMPERDTVHDPLAGRTDRPEPVPDADFKDITPGDRRREGMFGGVLFVAIPLAILAVGLFMWSTNIGTEGPAVDGPEVVADDQLLEPEDR